MQVVAQFNEQKLEGIHCEVVMGDRRRHLLFTSFAFVDFKTSAERFRPCFGF